MQHQAAHRNFSPSGITPVFRYNTFNDLRHIPILPNIQEQQGKRLDVLENQDGEMWRKVTGYIFTAILGIVALSTNLSSF